MRPHRPDGAVPMMRMGMLLGDVDHGLVASTARSARATCLVSETARVDDEGERTSSGRSRLSARRWRHTGEAAVCPRMAGQSPKR
jgi:hypothetical protein